MVFVNQIVDPLVQDCHVAFGGPACFKKNRSGSVATEAPDQLRVKFKLFHEAQPEIIDVTTLTTVKNIDPSP